MNKITLSLLILALGLSAVGYAAIRKVRVLRTYAQTSQGTLTLVNYKDENFILSASHVCEKVPMRFKSYNLKVVKMDRDRHLCMLQLSDSDRLEIAKTIELRYYPLYVGNGYPKEAIALGFGFGTYKGIRVQPKGVRSRLNIPGFQPFEVDEYVTPIQPGMSGGPTITPEGELIGINAATSFSTNTAYLVPYSVIKEFLDEYIGQKADLE